MEVVDMLTKLIRRFLFKNIGKLEKKNISIVLPNKKKIELGDNLDSLEIKFNSWRGILLLFRRGALGLTEGYIHGYWQTDKLNELMDFLSGNLNAFSNISDGMLYSKFLEKINHFLNKNSIKGSKKNIEAHYDLGNDFFSLWLDDTMTYSSGIFFEETKSLSEAQINKYQSILDLLDLKQGAKILEIGCGWGGFMEYASKKGFDIKGITISPSQFEFTKTRLKKIIEDPKIELIDYRNLTGRYDAVVSIEMFEAVGSQYWDIFFSKIKSLLEEEGKAAIQTITIGDQYFEDYKNNPDFIQKYIFPGGMLASDKIIHGLAETNGLKTEVQKEFSESYAKTLETWFNNFQKCWDKIETLNFDKKFKNTWDMYLAYCRGGFLNERIFVSQYLLKNK